MGFGRIKPDNKRCDLLRGGIAQVMLAPIFLCAAQRRNNPIIYMEAQGAPSPVQPLPFGEWLLLFPLSPRWGDDQFLGGLYFLPFPYHSTSGMPSGAALPLGGFFYLVRFRGEYGQLTRKRLCTSVSFLSQSKRPRPHSPPKGGGTASGLCMPG